MTLEKTIKGVSPLIKKDLHWVIVGDGPSFGEMKEALKCESVTFTGYLSGSELSNAYASAHQFIFPSTTETFGNVVLEAMASGLPSIVADSGGVKSIVQHERTGFLCEPGNNEQFIKRVEQLVREPKLRANMSKRARDIALKQSWEDIFDKLFDEYKQAISLGEVILREA